MKIVSPSSLPAPRIDELRSTAQKLEACFAAEMLRAAGLHSQGGAFGGGVGETQISSFLTEQYAQAIATAGGLNLTDCILSQLLKAEIPSE